jgi:hypothetical protein
MTNNTEKTYIVFFLGTYDSLHFTIESAEDRVAELKSKYPTYDSKFFRISEKRG